MERVTLYGDARRLLAEIDDDSIDCIVTSPPYWRQRDYGHPAQIGQEQTVHEYAAALADTLRTAQTKLKSHGTMWLNIGDVQSGGVLIGAPWRVAFALEQDGWLRRAAVIWHKTNALPESQAKQRPGFDYETVFLFAVSLDHYYDYDAVREPYTQPLNHWGGPKSNGNGRAETNRGLDRVREMRPDPRGKLRRSVWPIATARTNPSRCPAIMPAELAELCILAGCPAGGVVLDPFAGSGTTARAAAKHGRSSVSIELNPSYMLETRIVRRDELPAPFAGEQVA